MRMWMVPKDGSLCDPLLSGGIEIDSLDDFGLYPDGVTSNNSHEWHELLAFLESHEFDIWVKAYVNGVKVMFPAKWRDIGLHDIANVWAGRAYQEACRKNTVFREARSGPDRRAVGYTSPFLR